MGLSLQRRFTCVLPIAACVVSSIAGSAIGQERFLPMQGGTTELWRITNDPTRRDWANYHNAQCFSPDGRYVSFARSEPYGGSASEMHLFDLHVGRDIKIDPGTGPRWANNHNWLFYIRHNRGPDVPRDQAREVIWLDVVSGRKTSLGFGLTQLGGADCDDRWLFGGRQLSRKRQDSQGYRVAIQAGAEPEMLEGLKGIQWIPNPAHPTIFVRFDHYYEPMDDEYYLTKATRYWFDPSGGDIRVGSPQIQRCHQSWSGDGTYHLHGGTPMAGRRWDEPFPSNLHFLSAIGCGDISPCGRSGRWVCGSGNYRALQMADLRSGDGWDFLEAALSLIHDSDRYEYAASSALHDCDAKGSPDGTKVAFVSNYDLKDGPVARVTKVGRDDRIEVDTTEEFPASGRLSLQDEVIAYEGKTATSFEGVKRRLYRRGGGSLRAGRLLTSFEHRSIPEDQRAGLELPSRFARPDFADKDSPLIWQRRTDIYLAIVRQPDPPHLRASGLGVELIPGENHWETAGYRVFRDGRMITTELLVPGDTLALAEPGEYQASAVEWSGLESHKSNRLRVEKPAALEVMSAKPDDFSWTSERWVVDGNEASADEAHRASAAVRETVHRLEGVTDRTWYQNGRMVRRHDLNADGQPIRHLFYENGSLARREYHDRKGALVSTEKFDPDGSIAEAVRYDDGRERYHWWYDSGMPFKFTGRGDRSGNSTPKGLGTYVKQGDAWVKAK